VFVTEATLGVREIMNTCGAVQVLRLLSHIPLRRQTEKARRECLKTKLRPEFKGKPIGVAEDKLKIGNC
jgi:hypothetical protein